MCNTSGNPKNSLSFQLSSPSPNRAFICHCLLNPKCLILDWYILALGWEILLLFFFFIHTVDHSVPELLKERQRTALSGGLVWTSFHHGPVSSSPRLPRCELHAPWQRLMPPSQSTAEGATVWPSESSDHLAHCCLHMSRQETGFPKTGF